MRGYIINLWRYWGECGERSIKFFDLDVNFGKPFLLGPNIYLVVLNVGFKVYFGDC